MQYLNNLIAFLLPALSVIRLSVVEDNGDIFDWGTVPEQSYPPKPDLPTDTPIEMELYDVQTSPTSDSITLMFRNSEREGLASENYTIFNGNQAFVLDSWNKRFQVKSVQAPASQIKDAIKKHMESFESKTFTVVLDTRSSSDEIYNVNPIKSAKAVS